MNGNTPSYFIKISTLTKLLKMNYAKMPRDLLVIHIGIILCTSMHVYQHLNLIRVLYVYETDKSFMWEKCCIQAQYSKFLKDMNFQHMFDLKMTEKNSIWGEKYQLF